MADVTFQEEESSAPRANATAGSKGSLTKLIIAIGLAKDEKGAQMVLLGIAVAALVLAGIVLYTSGTH